MYILVFLLIFSTSTATGGKEVMLDILYTTGDTESSLHNVVCDVTPLGTIYVTEGDNIKFNVQTRSHLKEFWCYNAKNRTIFNPPKIKIDDGDIQTWKLGGPFSIYDKSCMDGKWTCNFRIKKPHRMEINAPTIHIGHDVYIESNCELQFHITVPAISLSIAQLGVWTWINQKQGKKRYNHTFTEGETTFNCSLNNPTDHEETYTISFSLDGEQQNRKPLEVIKARDKFILTDSFKLNSNSKLILCSATNVKGNGPTLHNEIHLQYVPPPRVLPNIYLKNSTAPQKLKYRTLIQENYTQIYEYEFTDEEQFEPYCVLNNAEGHEKHYALTLCIEGEKCAVSGVSETYISRTFTLKKEDRFKKIICTAYNKETSTDPSLPSYLYGIVYLQYSPREDADTNATPMLSITGPEKLLRSNDTIYHYNFTDGEIVEMKCTLNKAAGYKEIYDITFFNYNVSTDKNDFVKSSKGQKTSSYVYHNFTLEKEDKMIRCGAFTDKYDEKYYIDVFLHYTPQAAQDMLILNIEGSEQEKGFNSNNSVRLYSYEFTDGETITVTGDLNVNKENEDIYDIQFFLDEISEKQSRALPYRNGSSFKKNFTLKKKNKNVIAVVRKNNMPILNSTVKLNFKKPKTAPGLELTMRGLPANSCHDVDYYKILKICDYTFNREKTLSLECVLSRSNTSAKKNAEYMIQFGTHQRIVTLERHKSSTVTVSYEIPLKEENDTVKCTATKMNNSFVMTIEVNIIYIPPTTTTTTTTTTEPPTTSTESSITNEATPAVQEDAALQSNTGGDEGMGWLKWLLVGVLLIVTIGVVVACIVKCRQKKPPPAESTYANMGKDLNTYQTVPLPAPRTMQKPNATQKPNRVRKPKVTVENNYSEPKDSLDMSEAMYADPQRFNGDTDTYAEPYIKSKSTPQSDTYAEPYKSNYAEPYASNSEGNYAELSQPCSSKDLYAKPIPKAQREPKVKDESNYSNVFGDQYANTRK